MPTTPNLLDQFAQLRHQRSAVVVLLFLLVIVVFWIGIGLFSSQQKFAVPKAMRDLAKPLSPIVDESVFTTIERKRFYSPEELQNFTIYKVVVNETAKQLRLVDISYQETPAPTAGPGQSQTPSRSAPASSGSGETSSVATDSTTVASPLAPTLTPVPTKSGPGF